MESRHTNNSYPYHLFLENMTTKQWLKIKSFIVDANNYLNGIFLSFDSLNLEFFPGFRLINNSTIFSQTLHQIPILSLLLYPSCTSILTLTVSRKQSIMSSMLLQLRLNYSLSDMGLTKLFKFWKLLISLSLPMLFIWYNISLTL